MSVDLVYTWVNAADTDFSAQRVKYAGFENVDDLRYCTGPARFRDNDELRYSLRSVEKFLPFVRTIYVAHAGKKPAWLKSGNGLCFINQSELVPESIFPNYQSDVIESFLYRIPGLSEKYIYLNDDFFFMKPHQYSDFFDDSGRCKVFVSNRLVGRWLGNNNVYRAMELNCLAAMKRKKLKFPAIMTDNTDFIAALKKKAKATLLKLYTGLPTINASAHVGQSYLRSGWDEFHDVFRNELAVMYANRFRSHQGMTVNIMYHYFLYSTSRASFFPDTSCACVDNGSSAEEQAKLLEEARSASPIIGRFCLNDTPDADSETWGKFTKEVYQTLLPTPSRWEIES